MMGWTHDGEAFSYLKFLGEPGTRIDVVYQRAGESVDRRTVISRDVIRVPAVPFTLMFDGAAPSRSPRASHSRQSSAAPQ